MPDLAVPLHCQSEGKLCKWPQILRGVLSSWDALLDAEAELGVEGSVNFTVVFNATDKGCEQGSCASGELVSPRQLPRCYFLRHPQGCADDHDLRNMWLAANNLLNDSYEPHNKLGNIFTNRWVHSISAAMKSESVKR